MKPASGVKVTTPPRSDLRGTRWVHCALVVPANATVSQITAYLDGVPATPALEPANSGTVAINTGNANDVTIGRIADATAARAFGGVIDDVRIFPEALDAARIATLAAETPDQNHRSSWHFRYTGNSSPDWDADTDHDGFGAWLEYALGGNPTAANTGIAPVLENGVFRFHRRREGIPAAAYRPVASETMLAGSWESLENFSVTPHPEMPDFEVVSVPLPPSSSPSRFVRLEVAP